MIRDICIRASKQSRLQSTTTKHGSTHSCSFVFVLYCCNVKTLHCAPFAIVVVFAWDALNTVRVLPHLTGLYPQLLDASTHHRHCIFVGRNVYSMVYTSSLFPAWAPPNDHDENSEGSWKTYNNDWRIWNTHHSSPAQCNRKQSKWQCGNDYCCPLLVGVGVVAILLNCCSSLLPPFEELLN